MAQEMLAARTVRKLSSYGSELSTTSMWSITSRAIELLFVSSPLNVIEKWGSYGQSAFDGRSANVLWVAQRSDDQPGSTGFGEARAL